MAQQQVKTLEIGRFRALKCKIRGVFENKVRLVPEDDTSKDENKDISSYNTCVASYLKITINLRSARVNRIVFEKLVLAL